MKTGNPALLNNNFSIVLVLLVSILAIPQAYVAQQRVTEVLQRDEQITISTDLITVNVIVTDTNGLAVAGLSKSDFNIFDNNKLQEIQFFSNADVPASVSIVFDSSGSMQGKKMKQAKESLAQFIQTSKEQDEFFLIDFNSRPKLLLDRTHDSDVVLNKLTYVEPQGNTALYDAVYLGLEKALSGTHSRKIVLVISDGEDNNSRLTFKDLANRLKETDAVIYAIGFGGYFASKGTLSGRETLRELAETSGGQAFFPNNSMETDEVFEKIAVEIRRFYSIGYYPSDFAANSKWHRLKVKINFPAGSQRFFVRSRRGYYAKTNQ